MPLMRRTKGERVGCLPAARLVLGMPDVKLLFSIPSTLPPPVLILRIFLIFASLICASLPSHLVILGIFPKRPGSSLDASWTMFAKEFCLFLIFPVFALSGRNVSVAWLFQSHGISFDCSHGTYTKNTRVSLSKQVSLHVYVLEK